MAVGFLVFVFAGGLLLLVGCFVRMVFDVSPLSLCCSCGRLAFVCLLFLFCVSSRVLRAQVIFSGSIFDWVFLVRVFSCLCFMGGNLLYHASGLYCVCLW